MSLVEDTGFDAIDGGALAECWRQQPITRAYCSELTAAELRAALATADRARAPLQREKMVKEFMALGDKITTEDIVRCTGSQVLRHELTGGTQAETGRALRFQPLRRCRNVKRQQMWTSTSTVEHIILPAPRTLQARIAEALEVAGVQGVAR